MGSFTSSFEAAAHLLTRQKMHLSDHVTCCSESKSSELILTSFPLLNIKDCFYILAFCLDVGSRFDFISVPTPPSGDSVQLHIEGQYKCERRQHCVDFTTYHHLWASFCFSSCALTSAAHPSRFALLCQQGVASVLRAESGTDRQGELLTPALAGRAG